MTLLDMLERSAREVPGKPALIFEDRAISFGEMRTHVAAIATALARRGVEKGGRVGLLVRKSPEAVISFLGVSACGALPVPLAAEHPPAETQSALDLTTPSAIIAHDALLPILDGLRLPCRRDEVLAIGESHASAGASWWGEAARDGAAIPDVGLAGHDAAYLNFTSGSCGVPKAAICTHANLYWNTRAAVETLGLTRDDVHLSMFPVFAHPHELFARGLYLGGASVLVAGISPRTITSALVEHRVTAMMAVASIYTVMGQFLTAHPHDLSALRVAESGGMHVNRAVANAFRQASGIPILPVWGSTETTGIALAMDGTDRPGACGKPCRHYRARLVAEDGGEAAVDTMGELVIGGEGVTSGYYQLPAETAQRFRGGWFHTGDLFRKDADGYYYFAGRKTGMMKVAGLRVSPAEIEDVLSLHPAVSEVAVVTALDHTHGEVPKAVIALRPGATLTAREVRRYCESRLGRNKVPRICEFRNELPRGPGGKVLYRELTRDNGLGEMNHEMDGDAA